MPLDVFEEFGIHRLEWRGVAARDGGVSGGEERRADCGSEQPS